MQLFHYKYFNNLIQPTSKFYQKLNLVDSAYFYLQTYTNLREKTDSVDKSAQLQDLHVRFDYDRVVTQLKQKGRANKVLMTLVLVLSFFFILASLIFRNRHLKTKFEKEELYAQLALLKSSSPTHSAEVSATEDWETTYQKVIKTTLFQDLIGLLSEQKGITESLATELYSFCLENFPAQYDLVMSNKLSVIDTRVCFLTLLGFKPQEIANLISMSRAGVTNIRKKLGKVLFVDNTDYSTSDFDPCLRNFRK